MTFTMMRATAVVAIVLHHWFVFLPWDQSSSLAGPLSALRDSSGSFVHIFFVLSGFGLFLSQHNKRLSWGDWAIHRGAKILIPYWIIITLTFLLAITIGYHYSWQTLLAYLTLTRNFYSPSWTLNTTLWFMPVIVGLYAVFPLLFKVLERWGATMLLALSAVITYGCISACILLGLRPEHQNAFVLSYVIEFSFGMILAHMAIYDGERFRKFNSLGACCAGILLYGLSALIAHFWEHGRSYNDILTAVGLSLILMFGFMNPAPVSLQKLATVLSCCSYLLYLIHGPIISFLIKPLWNVGASASSALVGGILFCFFISFITYSCLSLSLKLKARIKTKVEGGED